MRVLAPGDDDATVATANLDTHAGDVLRLLDRARITSATLVGHSYGGMVIAAVADHARSPGVAGTGYAVRPPARLDPRTRPHPFPSLVQAIRLTGTAAQVSKRD